jgi:adenylylsulfate kinase-like enzyme
MGLPASGKSTVAAELARQMGELGVNLTVLESDALRKMFSTNPSYDERDIVVFDATANRRSYRVRLRTPISLYAAITTTHPKRRAGSSTC